MIIVNAFKAKEIVRARLEFDYYLIYLCTTNNQCFHHIETSQISRSTNQLTGFYLKGTFFVTGFNNKVHLTHLSPMQMILILLSPIFFTPRYFLDPHVFPVEVPDGSLGTSGLINYSNT